MQFMNSKPSLALTAFLLLPNFLPKIWAQTCKPFGVDFQDGVAYFQNSLSVEDFSFASEYEG